MFENTRWSNPNYQPNFDYAQRVEAAKLGQPWANFGIEAVNTIGKGIEAYGQRSAVQDILNRMNQPQERNFDWNSPINVSGGGSSWTEAGNPIVTAYVPPITEKELEELRKRYLQNSVTYPYELEYNFDYGVV